VERGLADLAAGRESDEALLVLVGATRLRRLGIPVARVEGQLPEHRLYRRLAERDERRAHSRFNSLERRLTAFERALRCAR
jgi:hypothetical protein